MRYFIVVFVTLCVISFWCLGWAFYTHTSKGHVVVSSSDDQELKKYIDDTHKKLQAEHDSLFIAIESVRLQCCPQPTKVFDEPFTAGKKSLPGKRPPVDGVIQFDKNSRDPFKIKEAK